MQESHVDNKRMELMTKIRDDLNFLHGQINALLFMVDSPCADLVESIEQLYTSIMKDVLQDDLEASSRFTIPTALCNHLLKDITSTERMCVKCGERDE